MIFCFNSYAFPGYKLIKKDYETYNGLRKHRIKHVLMDKSPDILEGTAIF